MTNITVPASIVQAVEAAERVLPIFEAAAPQDSRVRSTIERIRRFVETGEGDWVSLSGDKASEAADAVGLPIYEAGMPVINQKNGEALRNESGEIIYRTVATMSIEEKQRRLDAQNAARAAKIAASACQYLWHDRHVGKVEAGDYSYTTGQALEFARLAEGNFNEFDGPFPDGSHGSIPFLRNLARKLSADESRS